MTLRVVVVGAGLGGLCLAHALRQGGMDVSVHERRSDLTVGREGYRLHLDARGGLALRECLPPELFELFLATRGQTSRAFTVVDKRLRVRHRQRAANPDPLSTSVNRGTLREVLSTGLNVHWGQSCVGYESTTDGVLARFTDARSARGDVLVEADVLVGADGIGSAVRRQYLPHARQVDTGSAVIYGRTTLDERTLPLVPPPMFEGFTAIIGGQIGMATGLVQFGQPPATLGLRPVADYLMWALSGRAALFGALSGSPAADLHSTAARMVRSWHPSVRELVAQADVDDTFLVRVRAAEPVPAWPPSRVTVLGDAIHPMSPARGSGANTALQDAALLSRMLTGGGDPVRAIGAYEESMRDYGFAAVAASRAAEAAIGARRSWFGRRRGGMGDRVR